MAFLRARYGQGLSLVAISIAAGVLLYFTIPCFATRGLCAALVVLAIAFAVWCWAGVYDAREYWPFIAVVVVLFLTFYYVVVWNDLEWHWQAGFAAFVFGSLTGVTEVGSRYRDEPFKTVVSPYGLIYVVVNGAISLLALLLVLHYKDLFPFVGDGSDKLKAAIVAGFGATLLMRSKIAVVKSADNKDIAVGPDIVVSMLLKIVDTNIDRLRSVRRQRILRDNFEMLRALGTFKDSFTYLFNSLLAFQNLDDTLKKQVSDTYVSYLALKPEDVPDDIKRLALGFIFLTLVGESNFSSILEGALAIKRTAAASTATQPPAPPAGPAASPPGTPTP